MAYNRNVIIGIAAAVLVVAAVGIFMSYQNSGANTAQTAQNVKEFTMTSYYDPTAGRPFFSLNEMTVNRGDRVRVKVTNTMGVHDFTLDEFGIARETPLNEEVVIEFTADKTGDFVYYCSKPGHRAAGQWGTLRVL